MDRYPPMAPFNPFFCIILVRFSPLLIEPFLAVKVSALSSTKELCSTLQKALDDSQEPSIHASIISSVQEVIRVYLSLYFSME